MKRGKVISPAEVDFWLDSDKYSNFFTERTDASGESLVFSIDMVRLSSIRKAISNFVRILTRKSVPVYFNDADANVNFGGKVIYLSAQINNKHDFDVAVGQALHEGAHTLKTDFETVKVAWANIPTKILKLSDAKGIRRASLEKFIHHTWNVIEDRFIDNYVFNEAPGYRGYYVALYERFWHNPEVDMFLRDPDMFRYPSLDSYSFRICNFTNLNTDLLALPRLEDIARVIDISHIDRLKTTKERIETAFDVVEIVLDCLDKPDPNQKAIKAKQQQQIADPNDYFGDEDDSDTKSTSDGKQNTESDGGKPKESEKEEKDGKGEGKDETDVAKDSVEEISEVLGKRSSQPDKPKETSSAVSKISDEDELPKELQKQIKNVIESQRQFLNGELPKDKLDENQKSLLDLVEKHGIILVQVEVPNILAGDDKNLKVDCIVVQKMSKELVFAGETVFPLSNSTRIGNDMPEPPKDVADAVKKGIQIGTNLGRKLQIRAELHPVKVIRKKTGKINKRQLHEAASDVDDLFYKINIDQRHDANLHITVDASSSMAGPKWSRTMTAVVAICKAASMIDNVHVTVSFRATQETGASVLPYIVLAYDSKKDKFSKIRTLFPHLVPNGMTPEGLAFGAIMNLFEGITPDEEDRFFLNLSDGEPCYHLRVPSTDLVLSYTGETGSNHTKSQVDKIRRHGVEILSYFIETDYFRDDKQTPEERDKQKENDPRRKDFRKMYGKNAQFIDVESIIDLAKTINGLFLRGNNEKKS